MIYDDYLLHYLDYIDILSFNLNPFHTDSY